MTKNFNIEIEGAKFEFITMNRVKLQLYMVYVLSEGKKNRFHMQLGEGSDFYITVPQACPDVYLPLEQALSKAILENGPAE